MSVLSDFFLATPQEVQTCSEEDVLNNRFPILLAKNLTPTELASLEQILLGTDFGPLMKNLDHALVRDFGTEGPWIYPVRPALVETLVNLPSTEIAEVASAWAATEELRRASPAGLAEFLEELCELVRQPRPNGEQLYVQYVV